MTFSPCVCVHICVESVCDTQFHFLAAEIEKTYSAESCFVPQLSPEEMVSVFFLVWLNFLRVKHPRIHSVNG